MVLYLKKIKIDINITISKSIYMHTHIHTHIQRKRSGRIHATMITKVPLGNPRKKGLVKRPQFYAYYFDFYRECITHVLSHGL